MRDQNKSPLAPTSGQSTNNNRRAYPTKLPQKWKRVLATMAEGVTGFTSGPPGRRFSRVT